MSGTVTAHPRICLNMIVRNEAHVVAELLDSVAPYISSWVIVDTGSDDGTQELIRAHMDRLGIPGELYERPWRDFGTNRTQALTLAQGHGDYIWVMDADDVVVGTPDFTQLDADVYTMRNKITTPDGYAPIIWSPQLFRDGLRMRFEGATHEQVACDEPHVSKRLEGDYHIEYRHLGSRSLDPESSAQNRDLLLAAVERNPDDSNAVMHLAQTYFQLGDFASARKWYERRTVMGGSNELVYHAMCQIASSMGSGGAPWPDVQDALLRAWEFRPTRAETLHAIAAGSAAKSGTSALRSRLDTGCISARTGGSSHPTTSSPASPRCSRPNQRCSRSASTSPTRPY
ncbi:MAG: glycosyltransferase [Mycobacterium sp.]